MRARTSKDVSSRYEGITVIPSSAPGDPNEHLLHAAQRDVPYLDLLQIRPMSASDGNAVFEMIVDDSHLRTMGLLHGGAAASLLDTAMGFAAVTKSPAEHHVVTVQLSVNFIKPAWKAERLTATADVTHAGGKTAVVHGRIVNDDGNLIATATGTFMYLPVDSEGGEETILE